MLEERCSFRTPSNASNLSMFSGLMAPPKHRITLSKIPLPGKLGIVGAENPSSGPHSQGPVRSSGSPGLQKSFHPTMSTAFPSHPNGPKRHKVPSHPQSEVFNPPQPELSPKSSPHLTPSEKAFLKLLILTRGRHGQALVHRCRNISGKSL